jgi:hypothetical protein
LRKKLRAFEEVELELEGSSRNGQDSSLSFVIPGSVPSPGTLTEVSG